MKIFFQQKVFVAYESFHPCVEIFMEKKHRKTSESSTSFLEMSRFTPSTVDNILFEVRSIASAADFGKFVARRAAEQSHINWTSDREYTQYPARFFPKDPDSSTIDALLDKICDLAPIPLPREASYREEEHTWLACIRECAYSNQAFFNREHPRHVDVICRVVDALITGFTVAPDNEVSKGSKKSFDRTATDDAMHFDFVATTLAQFSHLFHYDDPGQLSGASDALIDFLIRGLASKHCRLSDFLNSTKPHTRIEIILVQAIFQSAALGKWVAQIALAKDSLWEVSCRIHDKVFSPGFIFPVSLGDPEVVRLCFRSLYIAGKNECCCGLPKLLEAILKNIPPLPSAFFNTPLNLPDEDGILIKDTLLSIAAEAMHCNDKCHTALWETLVNSFGADLNGLVEDPADSTKKIVSRRDGKTPAMLACANGCHITLTFFLWSKDLDITLKDNEGKSVVNHLLRRFECQKKHLQLLYDRDPALFAQHVTFADLDFAVRNGIHRSVIFLLSLRNFQFAVADLQGLFTFCFDLLLNSNRNEVGYPERDKTCGEMVYIEQEPDPHQICYLLSLPRIWIRHLSLKLRELGSEGIMTSFAGVRDRSPSWNEENEMVMPEFLFEDDDDDDEDHVNVNEEELLLSD